MPARIPVLHAAILVGARGLAFAPFLPNAADEPVMLSQGARYRLYSRVSLDDDPQALSADSALENTTLQGGTPSPRNVFPQMLPPDFELLGKLHYFMYGFHIEDVGVYLRNGSLLWGQRGSTEDLLNRMLGDALVRYEIKSPFFTRGLWARNVLDQPFRQQVERLNCSSDVAEEVDQMRKLINEGPQFSTGAVLDFYLDLDGVGYTMDGVFVNKRGTSCSSMASLASWVGDGPLSPDFKNQLLANLVVGESPASYTTFHTGNRGVFIGVIAGVSAGGAVLMMCLCFCCCPRRREVLVIRAA